jgi:signal recognition particle receptor subunit beta
MVLFNYATKEITAKIVYYGPGLCGKTTNLQFIYDSLPSNNKSKMLSLATKTDRTLFFDFLPLDLGKIRGMRTKLQLYTVPGQVYYNSTRQLVLKGADGVVFVADSQDFALDANTESLQNLEDNLKRQGIRIREIPLVIQYNKRDLPNALPVGEIDKEVNKLGVPHFESVATTGIGVEESLKGITQLVLAHLVKKYNLEGTEPLDREIQILNAPTDHGPRESLWEEGDEDATAVAAPSRPSPSAAAPPLAAPPLAAPPRVPAAAHVPVGVGSTANAFVVDDAGDDDHLPLVETELIGAGSTPFPAAPSSRPTSIPLSTVSPFEEVDYFSTSGPEPFSAPPPRPSPAPSRAYETPMEVPMTSIEIPLPPGILDSLPVLGQSSASYPHPPADDEHPPFAGNTPPVERRASDGLVKEISIPLNLTLDELRNHRRLRLKITLDVNLLP